MIYWHGQTNGILNLKLFMGTVNPTDWKPWKYSNQTELIDWDITSTLSIQAKILQSLKEFGLNWNHRPRADDYVKPMGHGTSHFILDWRTTEK